MPEGFTVDLNRSRLVVCKSGRGSVEEAKMILEEMEKLCRKHGLTSILFDLSKRIVTMDDLGLYRIAAMYERFAKGGQRIALVRAEKPDVGDYFTTVVRERGVDFRAFTSRSEAEAWLDENVTPGAPPDGV